MERPFDKIAVVVLDGVCCGEAADTKERFPEDTGANSLLHAAQRERLDAPALQHMGIKYVPGLEELPLSPPLPYDYIRGAFGALEPTFPGKESPEGHQALMGHEVKKPYLLFNKTGIPADVIHDIEREVQAIVGREVEVIRYPGTDDVSGTTFIDHPMIGPLHLQSKDSSGPLKLPVYASSDSVVQIAIHQEVLPQEIIERIGRAVRENVLNALGRRVGRVIMRPFTGSPGSFTRISEDRRDYGVDPDGETVIDHLTEAGIPVFGIGKAANMFNNRGFPDGHSQKFSTDAQRLAEVLAHMRNMKEEFIIANLIETDELYGHRRDPHGYIRHINMLSSTLGTITQAMTDRDLLMVTSDHGNDPTHTACANEPTKPHTNHTRERVPLLASSPRIRKPIDLGIRKTYADVAATIAENFDIEYELIQGNSFLQKLLP